MARRLSRRPLAAAAAGLVALDALLALAGADAAELSLLALLLAPGLAMLPLLPPTVRESPVASLAAAPALGLAASSVALISVSSAGIALNGTSVRLVLAALVLAGFLLPGEEARVLERPAVLAAAGLALAVAAGLVLQDRVVGGAPVPGNDWAKYALYADEIRAHGSLLIDNPYWMLGVPFREDPGAPSLYGGFLVLTGQPASVVVHGVWVLGVISILSIFAFVRALWGDLAGVLAAAFVAVLPISQDILAWHGVANLAALALLPLVLLYLTRLVTRGLPALEPVGLGLLLVALAAAHRLSLLVVGLTLLVAAAAALASGQARPVLRGLLLTAASAAVLAPGVIYDLVERGRSFGGTQDYRAYLSAKVSLGPVVGDLTVIFTLMAAAALVLAVRWSVRERTFLPLLSLLAVTIVLAYAWILHIPNAYFRMAYFLPVVLAPLVAVGLVRLLPARRAAAVTAVAALAIGAFAWDQGGNVRDFYAFSSGSSLRGLDAVSAGLRPREVVVTDRCWSFLATWLLHTRTLPALEPEDIQPKAELRRARDARAVLDGTPAGMALARRLGVRYLIVDPTCVDTRERPTSPPAVGTPLYVSKRLVVLRLPPT